MKARGFSIGLALLLCAPLAPAQQPEGRAYTPGPFDAIEITGSGSIVFTQGPVAQVFVEGGEALQESVDLRVRNGRLRIDQGGAWKFWQGNRLRIEVTAPELTRVSISGSANFSAPAAVRAGRLVVSISGAGSARFDQLDAESLTFDVSGVGDGTVSGSARSLALKISGRSDFHGGALRAERGAISITGMGEVEVWAVKDLDIAVAGFGKIDYWGTPAVRRSVSGSATINERGARPAAR